MPISPSKFRNSLSTLIFYHLFLNRDCHPLHVLNGVKCKRKWPFLSLCASCFVTHHEAKQQSCLGWHGRTLAPGSLLLHQSVVSTVHAWCRSVAEDKRAYRPPRQARASSQEQHRPPHAWGIGASPKQDSECRQSKDTEHHAIAKTSRDKRVFSSSI
jgi:hypothetical protein